MSEHEIEGFDIFTKTNLFFLLWFLAIYMVVYLLIKLFVPVSGGMSFTSRVLDITLLGLLGLLLFYFFYYTSASYQEETIVSILNTTGEFVNDWSSILYTLVFIIVFYMFLFVSGIPMTYEGKPMTVMIVETLVWILLVVEIIVLFFHNVLKLNITDIFKVFVKQNTASPTPEAPIVVGSEISTEIGVSTGSGSGSGSGSDAVVKKPSKQDACVDEPDNTGFGSSDKDEVFNISNNLYTYSDARAVCKAFDARLATYEDMEQAYESGADWCNYGWSENQMAYFPTQKCSWEKLQKDPKRKNNCGRPGINGGFMTNPFLKYGVNCYGKKPDPTMSDRARMEVLKNMSTPGPSDEELNEAAKISFWQENKEKLLNVNAFNKKWWSSQI